MSPSSKQLEAERLLQRNMIVCLPCIFPDRSLLASVTVGQCHCWPQCVRPGWPACLLLWHFKMPLATTQVGHRWLQYNCLPKELDLLLEVNPTRSEIRKSQKLLKYSGMSLHSTSLKSTATRYSRYGWEFRSGIIRQERLKTSQILMEIRKIDGVRFSSTWRHLNLGVFMWSRCLNSPCNTRKSPQQREVQLILRKAPAGCPDDSHSGLGTKKAWFSCPDLFVQCHLRCLKVCETSPTSGSYALRPGKAVPFRRSHWTAGNIT